MRYVAKIPAAVSGQGGHNATFKVACVLVWGFALSSAEAWPILVDFNSRCLPPWTEPDLRHKLESAEACQTHPKPRGHLLLNGPGRSGPSIHTAPSLKARLRPLQSVPAGPLPPRYDLSAAPELPDEIPDGARALIRAVFEPGEGIRIAPARLNEDGKEIPDGGGICLSREEWLQRLDHYHGDPNGIWKSQAKTGIYIAINPYKLGATKDADVTSFRHALVEFDTELTLSEQYALYHESNIPCSAIINSGGKSVHAWVKIDGDTRLEFDNHVSTLYQHFSDSGLPIDVKNKNPGRLSRLPFCIRFDRRQELLSLACGASSFTEWLKEKESDSLGKCYTIGELSKHDIDNDPNCIIGFRDGKTLRYLCKGKAAWLLGPSGIGKSSIITEFAISFALNRPIYGIESAKPLKSLIVQAENDDYDLAEMVHGLIEAHGLFAETDEWQSVNKLVSFKTETRATGIAFIERLHRLIDRDKPDVVWIDPMLSFMGIDVNRQVDVTNFLREQLTPVLESTGVVLIGVHHTGKPKSAKETAGWTAIDWAYQGLGSSELVNWARAVMNLRPLGDGFFELKLAKRGNKAGAKNPDGSWTNSIWLKHAAKGIRWIQVDQPDDSKPDSKPDKKATKLTKLDRIMALKLDSIIDSLELTGVGVRELYRRIEDFAGKNRIDSSRCTCARVADRLLADGRILKRDGAFFKP